MSSSNYQFTPTLDGLNNISGDSISSSNIQCDNLTVTNNLSMTGNINLNGTITAQNEVISGTITTQNEIVNGTLSIPSYSNVKTSLDTLYSRTTNQSYISSSNNTTIANNSLTVGTTVADVKTAFNIFGSQVNGIGVSRNGFMLTSPIAGGSSGQSVPIGLVNVIDQLFDIAINCGNVASSRNTTKQGCQMRFDARSTEKCWQLQMVDKSSGVVKNAINALDTGICEIPTQLDLLANVNMNQSGTGIISQSGTGTNIIKNTTVNGNLTVTGTINTGSILQNPKQSICDGDILSFSYPDFSKGYATYRSIRSSAVNFCDSYSTMFANQTLGANWTVFHLVKLNLGEGYSGAYFKTAGSGATIRMGLYGVGAGATLLASSANKTTTVGWNFVDFSATYQSTSYQFAFVALATVGGTLSVVTMGFPSDLNGGRAPANGELSARAQYCTTSLPSSVTGLTMSNMTYLVPMGIY